MRSRKFLFADEAGDFDFTRRPNGRRYFILCTVTLETCELGHFHACDDAQWVRDAVFARIGRAPMRVDATILEKSKAGPRIRSSPAEFYRYVMRA